MTKDYCSECVHHAKATDIDERMCHYCTKPVEDGIEPNNFVPISIHRAIKDYVAEAVPCEPMVKPPLGLTPRRIVDKARIREIFAAMNRYSEARTPIPIEWIDELEDIVGKYLYGDLEDYPLSGE